MTRRLASTGVELVAALLCMLPVASQHVDVLGYTAVVEPSFETQSIRGAVSVVLETRGPELTLDAGDLVIDSVSARGRPLPFSKRADVLHIGLSATPRTERRTIEIEYHGSAPRLVVRARGVTSQRVVRDEPVAARRG